MNTVTVVDLWSVEVFYNQLKSGLPRYQTQPVYPKGEGDWEGSGTETSTIVSGTRESGTKTKLYGVTNFSLLTFISSLTSTQTQHLNHQSDLKKLLKSC